MRTIYDGDLKLGMIIRRLDIKKDLNFYSNQDDFLQVGTWHYNKGKKLDAHIHNKVIRKVKRTQEIMYVIQGAVLAFIYSENKKLINRFFLGKGDILICLNGGHGFEILIDDTIVLEVKNGPYLGVEKDKRRI